MRPIHGGLTPESAQGVDLDFSVSLHPSPPRIDAELWLTANERIYSYPCAESQRSDRLIGDYLKIENAEYLSTTRGGVEALALALDVCGASVVRIPTPSFEEYAYLAEVRNIPIEKHLIAPEKWGNPASWLNAERLPDNAVIILSNPNNPTGNEIPAFDLRVFLKKLEKKRCACILDEAFVELTQNRDRITLRPFLKDHPNLLIAGSLTKTWGIPGLRIGSIATSNQNWMREIRSKKHTWSIDAVSEHWLEAMLQPDVIHRLIESFNIIHSERIRIQNACATLKHLEFYPSYCNFLLFSLKQRDEWNAQSAHSFFNKHGIQVRTFGSQPWNKFGEIGYFRIGIRKPDDNSKLIEAILDYERQIDSQLKSEKETE